MLLLLIGIVSSECYLADTLFEMKNGEAGTPERTRYEAAKKLCKDLVGDEVDPQNFSDWDTQEGSLTSEKVLFYTSKEDKTVNLNMSLMWSRHPSSEKLTVYTGGEESVTVYVESIAELPEGGPDVSLELLSSVVDMEISNQAEGMGGALVITQFDDRATQCRYITKDPNASPSIRAYALRLSNNLIQQWREGSIALEGQYLDIVIDENMPTGDISGLKSSGYRSSYKEDDGDWTIKYTDIYTTNDIRCMIREDTKVTIGKLSIKLESGERTVKFDYGTIWSYGSIDVQDDVSVDIFCEDNVHKDEFVGQRLSFYQYTDKAHETVNEVSNFKFHGSNWPSVEGTNVGILLKTETVRDPENKLTTVTRYKIQRQGMCVMDNRGGSLTVPVHFSVTGKNLPVEFLPLLNLTFHLEDSDVGLQGPLRDDVTPTIEMCSSGKCTLEVGKLNVRQGGVFSVNIKGEGELTIVALDCSEEVTFQDDALKFMCKNIDATNVYSDAEELKGLPLADNGVVHLMYRDPQEYSELSAWWDQNTADHLWFVAGNSSDSLWEDWKYVLALLEENAQAINKAASADVSKHFLRRVGGLTLLGKANIQVTRNDDVLYAPFYSSIPEKVICLEGDVDTSKWSVSFESTFSDSDYYGLYAPALNEYGITNVSVVQDATEKSCLAVKVGQPPNSAAVAIIYASNETYTKIVSGFPDFVTLVTPQTIDSDVTLSNPSSRNVFVLFLDSVPTGKSIRLGNVRSDGNVYAAGVPFAALDHVFKIVASASDADVPRDDVNKTIQNMVDALMRDYDKFFPSVSITTNHISSIVVAGANYVGDKLDCDNLYAFGSVFSDKISITASHTILDTFSYDKIKNIALNNVVLFPVSTNPVDHLSIYEVEYREDKITLKAKKGYFEFAGLQSGEDVSIPIITSNVKGSLRILSFTDSLSFVIPEGTKLKKVKGVFGVMGVDYDDVQITNLLPVVPLLSEQEESPIHGIVQIMRSALHHLFHAKALATTSKTVTFTGDWNSLEEIEGSFSIDTAADPVTISNAPAIVIESLQVRSSSTIDITLLEGVTDVHMAPQIVRGASQLSFSSSISVTFENITFAAGTGADSDRILSSSFSLFVKNQEKSIVANHVKCGEYSRAYVRNLLINNSLEVGRAASIQADTLETTELDITLHYSLSEGFPLWFDGFEVLPKSLTLFYDGDDGPVDTSYINGLPIRVLQTADECNAWKSSVSFAPSNPGVLAWCSDSVLSLMASNEPEDDGPPIGAIVGGVIGALVVIAIIVLVVLLVKKRKNDALDSSESSEKTSSVNND